MSGLPEGWENASLTDLLTADGIFTDGDWVESKDQDPKGSIRLLQLADIGDGRFVDKSCRFINEEKFAELRCTELFDNDVLIARMPDPLGRACMMPKMTQRCVTVVDVAVFRSGNNGVSNKWLMHTVNTPQLRAEIELNSSGTTRKRISRGNLAAMLLPIPPLAEQKRIADKLDSLLTRVDGCRDRLDRIPALLKRFRQSVLAAATSGRLTEDWRGTEERKDWKTTSLNTVCHSISDGDHQAPPQVKEGIPFITISAFNNGKLALGKASRFVPSSYYQGLSTTRRPSRGDVLYSVTGSIGIPALVNTDTEFTFQRHVAILKPDFSRISSDYLLHVLGSEQVRQQALAIATGTAQLTIPLNGLRALTVQLPSTAEQEEIVRRVETLFAFIDRIEARYATARKRVGQLTPALLAKAFRGELVAQNPADEPASDLLARLAATRAAAPKTRRGKKAIS